MNKIQTKLIACVEENDIDSIKSLPSSIDLNFKTDFGENLLFIACRKGFADVAIELINRGIDIFHVSNGNQLSLHAACEGGNLNIIKELVISGVNPRHSSKSGFLPIGFALKKMHLAPIIFFFENGLVERSDLDKILEYLTGNAKYTEEVLDIIFKYFSLSKQELLNLIKIAVTIARNRFAAECILIRFPWIKNNIDDRLEDMWPLLFEIKLAEIKNIQSHHIINLTKYPKHIGESIVTKIGGQPDWLTKEEWPVSIFNGQPMIFFGQIAIDQTLFPHSVAKVAYVFLDDSCPEDWESSNMISIILQPGDNSCYKLLQSKIDSSVSTEPFFVETQIIDEPDYVPDEAVNTVVDIDIYRERISGSKIGGIPCFIQDEEYPPDNNKWYLLLQLDFDFKKLLANFGYSCKLIYENNDKNLKEWEIGLTLQNHTVYCQIANKNPIIIQKQTDNTPGISIELYDKITHILQTKETYSFSDTDTQEVLQFTRKCFYTPSSSIFDIYKNTLSGVVHIFLSIDGTKAAYIVQED